MKVRQLYDILFTEYPGSLGFAPAVLTLALCIIVCGAIVYGGIELGRSAFAHTPAVETGHS